LSKIINAFSRVNLAGVKTRLVALATGIVLTLGQTVDFSSMMTVIQQMLPLLLTMISIAIPLMFIKYILRFIEKILGGLD